MSASSLNKNHSAVKRIMQEARELSNDPCTDYSAAPLEDDIFEWHCTLRGPVGTEFEGGLYHFRILLPAEYPFRPPSIMILTPNGRFELNTKICISFTSYHEELWQPAWGVRTAIIGLQGFFPLKGQAAAGVGSIDYPTAERKRLAALSREWVCPHCQQSNLELLPDPPAVEEAPIAELNPSAPPHSDVHAEPSQQRNEETETDIPMTVHSVDSLRTSHSGVSSTPMTASPTFINRVTMDTPPAEPAAVERLQRQSHKPPVLLDSAICVILVVIFALICRRMV